MDRQPPSRAGSTNNLYIPKPSSGSDGEAGQVDKTKEKAKLRGASVTSFKGKSFLRTNSAPAGLTVPREATPLTGRKVSPGRAKLFIGLAFLAAPVSKRARAYIQRTRQDLAFTLIQRGDARSLNTAHKVVKKLATQRQTSPDLANWCSKACQELSTRWSAENNFDKLQQVTDTLTHLANAVTGDDQIHCQSQVLKNRQLMLKNILQEMKSNSDATKDALLLLEQISSEEPDNTELNSQCYQQCRLISEKLRETEGFDDLDRATQLMEQTLARAPEDQAAAIKKETLLNYQTLAEHHRPNSTDTLSSASDFMRFMVKVSKYSTSADDFQWQKAMASKTIGRYLDYPYINSTDDLISQFCIQFIEHMEKVSSSLTNSPQEGAAKELNELLTSYKKKIRPAYFALRHLQSDTIQTAHVKKQKKPEREVLYAPNKYDFADTSDGFEERCIPDCDDKTNICLGLDYSEAVRLAHLKLEVPTPFTKELGITSPSKAEGIEENLLKADRILFHLPPLNSKANIENFEDRLRTLAMTMSCTEESKVQDWSKVHFVIEFDGFKSSSVNPIRTKLIKAANDTLAEIGLQLDERQFICTHSDPEKLPENRRKDMERLRTFDED